jgi:hypothetical protein
MLREAFIFIAIVVPSWVQSQPIVPSISPAFGGVSSTLPTFTGAIPSMIPIPSTQSASPASGLATAPFTFPPVLANFPAPPAGFNVCYVCGAGFLVVNKTSQVDLAGTFYTCEQVEMGGLRQLIPNIFCIPAFQETVATSCGCAPEPSSVAPSAAPVEQVVEEGASEAMNMMNGISMLRILFVSAFTYYVIWV